MPLPEDEVPSKNIQVNASVQVHQEGLLCVMLVGGIPVHTWSVGDRAGERFAQVLLVRIGAAGPAEVAEAFDCSRMTVFRATKRFDAGGLQGLVDGERSPAQPRVLGGAQERRMLALKQQGSTNVEIALKLGVTEGGIRKALKRVGYSAPASVQVELPGVLPQSETPALPLSGEVEAPVPPLQVSVVPESPEACLVPRESEGARVAADVAAIPIGVPPPTAPMTEASGQAQVLPGDAWDRSVDRTFARVGLINEAQPQFGDCEGVAGLGVLLALPALVSTGVFEVATQIFSGFGAAFYGVRSVMTCLSLMALLRVRRAEHLSHGNPQMLGRLLGFDRAPEVKTLRAKVELLSQQGRSEAFQFELAKRAAKKRPDALGFLYIDGHVRVYSGKVKLPKAHVTRMRLSMPATVDHWVNTRDGEPLLVITATPTAALAKELFSIAEEVKPLLGGRRATIVFDRGGWSPKLFAELIELGFDILTYRKGRFPKAAKKKFQACSGTFDGRTVTYSLAERTVKLKHSHGTIALREVVRLSEDGLHQTSIVTNRTDLSVVEVAYRMFERWRQENFFKYMGEEFELDGLWTYGTEEADGERDVPNPKRKKKEQQLKEARAELGRLERLLGAAASQNEESRRPSMRGFKIANAEVGQALRETTQKVARLRAEQRRIPSRVSASEAAAGKPVVRLKTEAKRLTDTIKMVAYQAETNLVRLIQCHYRRHEDDGRKLIASAMKLTGDIQVRPGELHLTLQPMATPNRTRAIARLCEELNATKTLYPGTRLVMHYAIRGA